MGIVVVKPQNSVETPAVLKTSGRLQRLLSNWFASQSSLQQQWQRFRATSGSHVSYRIWSRHGAYLEMTRGIHKL